MTQHHKFRDLTACAPLFRVQQQITVINILTNWRTNEKRLLQGHRPDSYSLETWKVDRKLLY